MYVLLPHILPLVLLGCFLACASFGDNAVQPVNIVLDIKFLEEVFTSALYQRVVIRTYGRKGRKRRLTVMSDSMCCETILNTDELAFGSSSHQSEKHSAKSSYLSSTQHSESRVVRVLPSSCKEGSVNRIRTSICAPSVEWRVVARSESASIVCCLRRWLPYQVLVTGATKWG